MKPHIVKLGTIDLDLVETTPIVFGNVLYRFEYVRARYWGNRTGDSYFRFVEHDTGRAGEPFAAGYHLGNAMSADGTMYVTGTDKWNGERIDLFASRDLRRWEKWNALNLPGYGIFNTSLCRAGEGFALMFEVSRPPEIAGVPFTARFAISRDLRRWELTPPECVYAKDRYTAPHCLRWMDGWYYLFYLESIPDGYEQRVVRSRDLSAWEPSPLNPVLKASDDDRIIANLSLTPHQRARIKSAENINNSDIDFCEFGGRLVINYSWGDQRGTEHLAEARFDGTLSDFLSGWFPAPEPRAVAAPARRVKD